MSDPKHAPFDGEISVRGIAGFGIGVVVVTLLAAGVMWAMNDAFETHRDATQPEPLPLARTGDEHVPPAPNLQTLPEQDFDAFLTEQVDDLHSYKLLDPNEGIVQVPIEDAIERIVRDGAPHWEAPAEEGS